MTHGDSIIHYYSPFGLMVYTKLVSKYMLYMVGSDTNIGSAWSNHNCIPRHRADACIRLYTIQKPAFTHACNRPVTKCLIYLNFMHHWQVPTSCMFHNELLLVCPLHEHSKCHRLGWPAAVGFHTDLHLSCRSCCALAAT